MIFTSKDFTQTNLPEADKTIVFTGHRPSGNYFWMKNVNGGRALDLRTLVKDQIRIIKGKSERVLCLTGGALGFDQIAGYAANEMKNEGVAHIVCIPFYGQWNRWDSASVAQYVHMVNQSTGYRYTDEADGLRIGAHRESPIEYGLATRLLLQRNEHMVRYANHMICFYDGSRGGTQYTVNRFSMAHGDNPTSLVRIFDQGMTFGSFGVASSAGTQF